MQSVRIAPLDTTADEHGVSQTVPRVYVPACHPEQGDIWQDALEAAALPTRPPSDNTLPLSNNTSPPASDSNSHGVRQQRMLNWLQTHLGIVPEHLTQRHDNITFVLLIYLHPFWFTGPYLLAIWPWIYWPPILVYCICTAGISALALWHSPPDKLLFSRANLACAIPGAVAFAAYLQAPLVMVAFSPAYLPLGSLLAYTGAVFPFLMVQVCRHHLV